MSITGEALCWAQVDLKCVTPRTWKIRRLPPSATWGGWTADVQATRGCCSEKASLWSTCFDHQPPSSVASGPILHVFIFHIPCFQLEKFCSFSCLISQRLPTGNSDQHQRPCVHKLSWWSLARSKGTMVAMKEFSSLEHLPRARHYFI